MNNVILSGRLVADIENRTTDSRKTIGRFRLAVDRLTKSDEKQTDFISCKCFDKTAENIERYCGKGRKIIVTGQIRVDNYEKDGERKSVTYVLVNSFEFCDKKPEATEPKQTEADYDGEDCSAEIPNASPLPDRSRKPKADELTGGYHSADVDLPF